MSQHTPTPWKLSKLNHSRTGIYRIEGKPKMFPNQTLIEVLSAVGDGEANADFIVRAVNSHKELIDRLVANTVGFHEAAQHSGPVNKCGNYNCLEAFKVIAQAERP